MTHREAVAALDADGPGRPDVAGAAPTRATGRADAAVATLTRAAERSPASDAVATASGRLWLDWPTERRHCGAAAGARRAAPTAARPDASSETLSLYGRALLLDGYLTAGRSAC